MSDRTHRIFQAAFQAPNPVMDAARDWVMGELVADEIAGALMNDGGCDPELWREWQRKCREAVAERMER